MHSDRAALIAAIREAPDDDAPRLVCADWFEEQGDEVNVARAAFIRTQIERARLPDDDLRHSELEARELRLLKRYAAVWCGSHFVFKKVRFRRGFVEYVHLHLTHFLHHRRQMLALEPVRDVRLTGWHRAPADLVRRVAACEEWREVETLRIHHQGPHKDPGGSVLLLLESPHLARLKTLHGPGRMALAVDERRRFERLPVLRQVVELHLPDLDRWPQDPGEWLSDGGEEAARQWGALKALAFPGSSRAALFQRISALPFWDRLEALEVNLSFGGDEGLSILARRLPPSLREFRLRVNYAPFNDPGLRPLLERLAEVPLRTLRFGGVGIPVEPAVLERLVAGGSLKRLSVSDYSSFTPEHARAVASSPGAKELRWLELGGGPRFAGEAARVIFSSEHLRSLTHLVLTGPRVGREGAAALASAIGWDRLRSLDLSGVDAAGLEALVESPNLRRLNWLSVRNPGPGDPHLLIAPEVAEALVRLPHLANLHLVVSGLDPRSRRILSQSDTVAWVSIWEAETWDVHADRAARAPDRFPPLDAAQEQRPGLE